MHLFGKREEKVFCYFIDKKITKYDEYEIKLDWACPPWINFIWHLTVQPRYLKHKLIITCLSVYLDWNFNSLPLVYSKGAETRLTKPFTFQVAYLLSNCVGEYLVAPQQV